MFPSSSYVRFCLPYISSPSHWIFKILVSTPLIMGDRHKNSDDLGLRYKETKISLREFFLVTLYNGTKLLSESQNVCSFGHKTHSFCCNLNGAFSQYYIILHNCPYFGCFCILMDSFCHPVLIQQNVILH
jgi:hypothetical protein